MYSNQKLLKNACYVLRHYYFVLLSLSLARIKKKMSIFVCGRIFNICTIIIQEER